MHQPHANPSQDKTTFSQPISKSVQCSVAQQMTILLRSPWCRVATRQCGSVLTPARPHSSSALDQPVRLSKHFVPTLRAESTGYEPVNSVKRLLRGGYMRQSSSGLYTLLPNGLRMIKKIERIIDEQMIGIGASKLEMPTMLHSALWHQSGRFDVMGSELYKVHDRRGTEYVLGPTFEEEVTRLVGEEVQSGKQLPIKVYQITQKHRDEPRPRSGLLRTRGFLMKDLYTFDGTVDEAEKSYEQVRAAYDRIMTRLFGEQGMGFHVAEADSGAMGGKRSHEYQVADALGEDDLLSCAQCGYAANGELAIGQGIEVPTQADQVQVKLYGVAEPSEYGCVLIAVMLPRNSKANPIKLAKQLALLSSEGASSSPSPIVDLQGSGEKNASWDWKDRPEGPLVRFDRLRVVADHDCGELTQSAMQSAVLLAIEQYGSPPASASAERDRTRSAPTLSDYFPMSPMATIETVDLRQADNGDGCGCCGAGTLQKDKAVEVGHTFLLGTRYSDALGYTFMPMGGQGREALPLQMGCYGIGLTRILGVLAQQASQRFDKLVASSASTDKPAKSQAKREGLVWNAAVAPFRVLVLLSSPDKQSHADAARTISAGLISGSAQVGISDQLSSVVARMDGSDIAIDDRSGLSFGLKMAEADLVGYPAVLILGKHFDATGEVEVRYYDKESGTNRVAHLNLSAFASRS